MAPRRANTTAAGAGENFPSDVDGTFTNSVCERTSVSVSMNSGSESRGDSNGCWRNNVVQIAVPDTVIDDLMERQKDRVKLHNGPRSAIHPAGEGSDRKRNHEPGGSRKREIGPVNSKAQRTGVGSDFDDKRFL